MLLKNILERNVLMYPNKTATVWGQVRHTFLELSDRVNKVANALHDRHVSKGDRVAVILKNCSPYIELQFGIPQGGMIIVPLNYRNRERELIYAINDSGANTLFAGSEYTDLIDSILPHMKGVKNFISVGGNAEGYEEYEEVLSQSSSEKPKMGSCNEDDVIAIMYTSGTTGRSKGAMIMQKNPLTEVRNSHAVVPISPDDVGMNFFPYYHVGFVRTPTYMAMGATNICADFSPQAACELIERERVTQIAMSPAQVTLFVSYPDIHKYDLSSLRKVISGGGHNPLATVKKFFEIAPKGFEIYYSTLGMTEACACLTGKCITRDMLPEIEKEREAFVGRKPSGVSVGIAYPYCQVRIVDDEGKDVEPWEIGEIICRGDNVMKGYWRSPTETKETLRDGWLHGGDMGLFTDKGEIYVVDRKKDMILSGDENIYPAEVEEVLHLHPSVLEAAVIGVPDERWGETVKALVVLKAKTRATEREIIDFCKKRLSSYKKPTSVDFLDQLPRNPSGKVLKRELRERYARKK